MGNVKNKKEMALSCVSKTGPPSADHQFCRRDITYAIGAEKLLQRLGIILGHLVEFSRQFLSAGSYLKRLPPVARQRSGFGPDYLCDLRLAPKPTAHSPAMLSYRQLLGHLRN